MEARGVPLEEQVQKLTQVYSIQHLCMYVYMHTCVYVPYNSLKLFHKLAYSNFEGKVSPIVKRDLTYKMLSENTSKANFHKWQLIHDIHENFPP